MFEVKNTIVPFQKAIILSIMQVDLLLPNSFPTIEKLFGGLANYLGILFCQFHNQSEDKSVKGDFQMQNHNREIL